MTRTSSDEFADRRRSSRTWTPWQAIVGFGLVSLTADMLYEGMRAMAGPFLGTLGASALTVGLVTGAGEGIALVLRLVTGPWADRSHRHWRLTVVGYAMTAVCVPLLAVTPFLGGAGLAVASLLILLERTGKAVRSPAKSALLARMAQPTGRGRGFAVHKALDQVGAFSGPLLLAGVAALTGLLWPGFALLAIPGALSLVLLAVLRRRVPGLADPDPEEQAPVSAQRRAAARAVGRDLPRTFHRFSLAAAFATAGLMTFGVMAYRFVEDGLLSPAAIPLVYALGMAVAGVAALATGDAFDRWGPRTLVVVPPLVAVVPLLVFANAVGLVLLGIGIWGVANGIQDSSVKAYVADLVPAGRRATAYGVFAAVQGIGALAGGALAGALITDHVAVLASVITLLQVGSLALLWPTTRRRSTSPG
ncbi:MFS transporter [Nocardioides sp. SOB44]|uniref:MFS transporter n=1 Tax=Nocardioides cremeus TaxID=3058044 RepID=A0ABT8TYT5_9ACTN|nr:MFS transporter [Nocardioides cremeus]MDO3397696.1 MFS transporter [Nocardioides cremeus]